MADNAQALESIYELSRLLNTGLDRETLAILIQLIQQGVHPEALAAVVQDLRRDALAARQEHDAATASVAAAATSASAQLHRPPLQFQPPQKEPMKKRRSEYKS